MLAIVLADALAADNLIEPATLEAWVDPYFEALVENHNVSGAVVSVVQGGELVLERAYGLGDVVSQTAASSAATRVRIGSTTKTFTALIVAQLIEEGRITSVDDPVNRYLSRFVMPDNDGVEITVRHLLTHTAGFADRFYAIGARDPVAVPAGWETIETLRPEFARPAGQRVVYSNFGVAALGYLIEDVVGAPIERVMQERIFTPLGMARTELAVTIEEPAGLAKPGVIDHQGIAGPTPFTAINPAVAQTGSIVSTAQDMSRYVNALLGHSGHFSAGVRTMLFEPLAGNAEPLTKLGMAFFIDSWDGRRVVSHGGNWAGFHTWMTLLPDDDVGIFVTLLSEARGETIAGRFRRAAFPESASPASPALLSAASTANHFLGEILGPKRPLPEQIAGDMPVYAPEGVYRAERRPYTTLEALSALVLFGAGAVDVSHSADGLWFGKAGPWLPDGAGGFVLDHPSRPMLVGVPATGDQAAVLVPDIGIYTFAQIPSWQDPRWHALVIHLVVPLTMLGLIALLWVRLTPWALAPSMAGVAGLLMVLLASVGLAPGETLMSGYYEGQPARLVMFVVAANCQLLAGMFCVPALLGGGMTLQQRLLTIAVMVLVAMATVIFWPYNVIGIHRI